jgi:hypothetical protein
MHRKKVIIEDIAHVLLFLFSRFGIGPPRCQMEQDDDHRQRNRHRYPDHGDAKRICRKAGLAGEIAFRKTTAQTNESKNRSPAE